MFIVWLFFILRNVIEWFFKKNSGCCGLKVLLNAIVTQVDLVDVGNSETLTCEIFIWFWGLEKLSFSN